MFDHQRGQGLKIGEDIKAEMHIPFSLEGDRHEFPSGILGHIKEKHLSKLILGKYLAGQENHARWPEFVDCRPTKSANGTQNPDQIRVR